jgi:hypothetical protein
VGAPAKVSPGGSTGWWEQWWRRGIGWWEQLGGSSGRGGRISLAEQLGGSLVGELAGPWWGLGGALVLG